MSQAFARPCTTGFRDFIFKESVKRARQPLRYPFPTVAIMPEFFACLGVGLAISPCSFWPQPMQLPEELDRL
jgi:hypothetical protein